MSIEIRILTVRQPFAHLIVSGAKKIENRSRPLSYRGPLLIHAGQRWYDRPISEIERAYGVSVPRDLPQGGIIGVVGMIGCVTQSTDKFFTGPYGWVLSDATPLPLIPCRGNVGLTKPTATVMAHLRTLRQWKRALGRASTNSQSAK